MAFAYTLNSAKTEAKVSHSFRTVKINGEPKKRDAVEFSFAPYTDSDDPRVNAIINESLAQYGKILLAENADDWEYIPSMDSITLEKLYEYQSAPSARGNRLINKVTLGEITELYIKWAMANGKSKAQADTGAKVIGNQFKDILGNSDALKAMLVNISSFVDSDMVTELSDDSMSALVRLSENLVSLTNPEITADSL